MLTSPKLATLLKGFKFRDADGVWNEALSDMSVEVQPGPANRVYDIKYSVPDFVSGTRKERMATVDKRAIRFDRG